MAGSPYPPTFNGAAPAVPSPTLRPARANGNKAAGTARVGGQVPTHTLTHPPDRTRYAPVP